MNSSFEVASSENSSLAVNEEEASPLLYGRYGYSLIIIGAVAMFVDVICMHLVRKSKTIFKNLQVYIISLMACYFFVAFSFTLAPLGFLLFKSTFAIDLGVSFGRSVVISSLLHTAVLSLDRLLSIKQPNFYSFRVTPRICYGVCFCIWFVSALNNIVVHAFVTFQPVGGRFNVGVYSSFVFVYFSCLFVYIGSSRSIIVCAKKHIRRENVIQRIVGAPRDSQNLETFRLSIIITTASGFLYLLYLPSQLFALFTFFDPYRKLKTTLFLQNIAFPSYLLESLLGPLLYLVRFRETRQMLKSLCCFSNEDAVVSRDTSIERV